LNTKTKAKIKTTTGVLNAENSVKPNPNAKMSAILVNVTEFLHRLYASIRLIERGKQVISAKNFGGRPVLNTGSSMGMPYLIE
jgi:hypothetical protein